MTAKALLKLSISPRKTGLVAQLVRGMRVDEALRTLGVTRKRCAPHFSKCLLSAVANYRSKEGQGDTTPGDLYIKELCVGSAGMTKRIRPVAKGMSHRIRKRRSRIAFTLEKTTPHKGEQGLKSPKNTR